MMVHIPLGPFYAQQPGGVPSQARQKQTGLQARDHDMRLIANNYAGIPLGIRVQLASLGKVQG